MEGGGEEEEEVGVKAVREEEEDENRGEGIYSNGGPLVACSGSAGTFRRAGVKGKGRGVGATS